MTRPHVYLLGLILVLAAVVRAYGLSAVGFWTDELGALSAAHGWGLRFAAEPTDRLLPPSPLPPAYTRLAGARPIRDVVPGLVRDESHPPVYFLLLRLWEDGFGDGEAAVRSLNVILSVAAVALLYRAAAPDVGRGPALWACLLMAVATPPVQFALEARNYTPGLAASLAAVVAADAVARRPTRGRAAVLGIALLLMPLTHYFTAPVAAVVVGSAVARTRGRGRRLVLVAAGVAAAAFLLAWGPAVCRQLPNFRSNYTWLSDAGPGRVDRWARRLLAAPARLMTDAGPAVTPWVGAALLLSLPVLFVRRPELRRWVLWLLATLGLVAGLDLARGTTQLALTRYTLFAAPAAYVLVAAAVRGRLAPVLPAVCCGVALLSVGDGYAPAWKTDLRTPVQAVGRRLGPGDGLVIAGPDPTDDSVVLAAFRHYLPEPPPAAAVLTRRADPAVLARLRQCPHVWLVWLWPADRPVEAVVPGYRATDVGRVPHFATVEEGVVSEEGTAGPAGRR